MQHNPGGVFGPAWRGQSYAPPRERRPYEVSYGHMDAEYERARIREAAYQRRLAEERKAKERKHYTHDPGHKKCWCGYQAYRKVTIMSEPLWCDSGHHAFSSLDPDRERYSRSKMEKDEEFGGRKEVTTIVDICGPCYAKHNPFPANDDPTPAIPENESYLKGYRDGVVKGETIS